MLQAEIGERPCSRYLQCALFLNSHYRNTVVLTVSHLGARQSTLPSALNKQSVGEKGAAAFQPLAKSIPINCQRRGCRAAELGSRPTEASSQSAKVSLSKTLNPCQLSPDL
ncbi:hypothetical protein EYF80_035320 [Liparis tanakae]|uniref:Uncharacterized protein n=1 Tax=Liparis tanakae TaxID=230148 RepID=A0A4Z2GP86_9TELE|nr:hypothetical protein EYF80_035320 [Liparis tanakae]